MDQAITAQAIPPKARMQTLQARPEGNRFDRRRRAAEAPRSLRAPRLSRKIGRP